MGETAASVPAMPDDAGRKQQAGHLESEDAQKTDVFNRPEREGIKFPAGEDLPIPPGEVDVVGGDRQGGEPAEGEQRGSPGSDAVVGVVLHDNFSKPQTTLN